MKSADPCQLPGNIGQSHSRSLSTECRLCGDPAAEAERAASIARHYLEPDGLVSFGIADAEVLPLLENELSRIGIAHYNPEGRIRRSEGFYALLAAMAALAREPSFDALAALARCPDFLACLQVRFGNGFSAASFLAQLDDLRSRHLPADLSAAKDLADIASIQLARGLSLFQELHGLLTAGEFPANATAALTLLFRERRFDLDRSEHARAADAAEAWRKSHANVQARTIYWQTLNCRTNGKWRFGCTAMSIGPKRNRRRRSTCKVGSSFMEEAAASDCGRDFIPSRSLSTGIWQSTVGAAPGCIPSDSCSQRELIGNSFLSSVGFVRFMDPMHCL